MELENEKQAGQPSGNSNMQHSGPDISGSNTVKNPDDWTTGDEPMTGAQASYLKTLSDEAGEPFDDTLSKAMASKRINELQHVTGRGLDKNTEA
jgi:hypothetical protein